MPQVGYSLHVFYWTPPPKPADAPARTFAEGRARKHVHVLTNDIGLRSVSCELAHECHRVTSSACGYWLTSCSTVRLQLCQADDMHHMSCKQQIGTVKYQKHWLSLYSSLLSVVCWQCVHLRGIALLCLQVSSPWLLACCTGCTAGCYSWLAAGTPLYLELLSGAEAASSWH